MTGVSSQAGVSIAITNARMGASKRGIAVELALRLALAADTPVCLVGADPTDRDVERRVAQLVGDDSEHAHMQLVDGTRSLEAFAVPARGLCIVSIPDRVGVEAVLPELQSSFRYVIIDAPSRVGGAIGIARVLIERLNILLVATNLPAGDLADARDLRRAAQSDTASSAHRRTSPHQRPPPRKRAQPPPARAPPRDLAGDRPNPAAVGPHDRSPATRRRPRPRVPTRDRLDPCSNRQPRAHTLAVPSRAVDEEPSRDVALSRVNRTEHSAPPPKVVGERSLHLTA